jgi:1-acyl-sn-glycerol-3-phosphate acyltransferase
MRHWLSYIWYEGCYWLSAGVMTSWFSLRVEGSRNVSREGPALLVANHQSFIDPVLIALAARRHLCYLARKTLFHDRVFSRLIRSLNAVPINQEGFAREGLETILEQLKAGRAVVVFPEGERTMDGKMHPLRPGVYLLIRRLAMPIVPIGIAGAYDAWPRWRRYPIPAPLFLPPSQRTIAVSIGRPLDSRQFAGLARQRVLDVVYGELQKMAARAEHLRRK